MCDEPVRLHIHELFNSELFDAIGLLPSRKEFSKQDLLTSVFRLSRSGNLEIYYAPFDSLNPMARIAIVGITPGWTQMKIAYREYCTALSEGLTFVEASRRAKESASFAGSMRGNLIRMLDDIGLSSALGLQSCDKLFDDARHLVHTTSAIRYPAFVNGRNYTGHSPEPLKHPELRRYVEYLLADELRNVPQALIVPLGKSVRSIMDHLIEAGHVDRRRCLLGFPHPSGANGHRQREFNEQRQELRRIVENWFSQSRL